MNLIAWEIIAVIFYGVATTTLFLRVWRRHAISRAWVIGPAALAALGHAILFSLATYSNHRFNLNFYNALSLVAVIVIMITLAASVLRPFEHLGIVLFPAATATVIMQSAFGRSTEVVVQYGWQMQMHIAIAVFAFAVLSIAAAQAILLYFQERALRAHLASGPPESLPALQTMESMLFQLITIGFSLLSLTLVSGAMFVEDLMGQHLAHKTVLSAIAWLVFGLLLWGRWKYGWRGRTAVRMTLAGMLILLLAFFGSKLVLELVLQRAG